VVNAIYPEIVPRRRPTQRSPVPQVHESGRRCVLEQGERLFLSPLIVKQSRQCGRGARPKRERLLLSGALERFLERHFGGGYRIRFLLLQEKT